jgi:hypothetical protein
MQILKALKQEATKLQSRLDRINAAITALNGIDSVRGRKRGGYKLSAATRRKMSLAQKKIWATRRAK